MKEYPRSGDVSQISLENLNHLKYWVALQEISLAESNPKPNYIVILFYKPSKLNKINFSSFRLSLKRFLMKSKNIDLNKVLLVDSEKDSVYPYAKFATYWFFKGKKPTVDELFGRGMRYVNIFGKEIDISNLEK